jgi:primosomal protein N' (replication factor Y)
MGSATPSLETYYHATKGDYRLLALPERVTINAPMPEVKVVDMREELKSGNRSVFSRKLIQGSKKYWLTKNRQFCFLTAAAPPLPSNAGTAVLSSNVKTAKFQ